MDTKKLRQKILDLAIHGKLVPQDPNDEPASVLLERIRTEKERLIKEGKIKAKKKSAKTSDTPHYENMPFEIPNGWEWCKLDDLAFYKKGPFGSSLTKSMFVPESPSVYKVYEQKNAINKDCSLGHYFINAEKYEELKGFAVSPHDIIVSCAGTIGETYVLPDNIRAGIINQALMIIRLYDTCITDFYLLYFDFILKYEAAKESKGTAIKNIPPFDILKNFLVPIPPLSEQTRIIEEVNKWLNVVQQIDDSGEDISNLIYKTKSKILDLAIHGKLVPQDPNDEPASELLKRINPKAKITCDNAQYGNVPEGWCVITIGDVAMYTNGRAFKPEEWMDKGMKIIRIQNLNDNAASYNYTSSTYEPKYLVKKGDLLFAWAASLGTYIWNDEDAWLNQHIFKVEPFSFIQKKYLFYTLQAMISDFYVNTHGSGMVHITKKKFDTTTFLLPPLPEQHRIVSKIEELFAELDKIESSLQA